MTNLGKWVWLVTAVGFVLALPYIAISQPTNWVSDQAFVNAVNSRLPPALPTGCISCVLQSDSATGSSMLWGPGGGGGGAVAQVFGSGPAISIGGSIANPVVTFNVPQNLGNGNVVATPITGTTAGSANCGEPFQGTAGIAFKKVTCVLSGYENTTATPQTYGLAVAFSAVASATFTSNCRDPLTLTAAGTLTFPVSESATETCVANIEGQ